MRRSCAVDLALFGMYRMRRGGNSGEQFSDVCGGSANKRRLRLSAGSIPALSRKRQASVHESANHSLSIDESSESSESLSSSIEFVTSSFALLLKTLDAGATRAEDFASCCVLRACAFRIRRVRPTVC